MKHCVAEQQQQQQQVGALCMQMPCDRQVLHIWHVECEASQALEIQIHISMLPFTHSS
jgi:hypothetical protein